MKKRPHFTRTFDIFTYLHITPIYFPTFINTTARVTTYTLAILK